MICDLFGMICFALNAVHGTRAMLTIVTIATDINIITALTIVTIVTAVCCYNTNTLVNCTETLLHMHCILFIVIHETNNCNMSVSMYLLFIK